MTITTILMRIITTATPTLRRIEVEISLFTLPVDRTIVHQPWFFGRTGTDMHQRWRWTSLPKLSLALLACSISCGFGTPPAPSSEERRIFAETILASTTTEWGDAFAAHGLTYRAPRAVFLRPPRRHPARGFGYIRGIGIDIDLGEMADLQAIFPANADGLTAFVIAHEVAHHAQVLVNQHHGIPESAGPDRELEADCAAGWWLARANARHGRAIGQPLFDVASLLLQLPRAMSVLGILKQREVSVRENWVDNRHGDTDQRLQAIQRGLQAVDVADCGPGLNI